MQNTLVSFNPIRPLGAEFIWQIGLSTRTGITFNDVLLEPQYSDIETRTELDVSTFVTPLRQLRIPLVAANMDTVCDSRMAIEIGKAGGLGVIHRYMPYEKQIEEVRKVSKAGYLTAAAIGLKNGSIRHAGQLYMAGCQILVIDVAHGHHKMVADTLSELHTSLDNSRCVDELPVEYIAGNVATASGAKFLIDAGADTIKVGVGPGSVCDTRSVTGHGMPQLSAIAGAVLTAFEHKIPVMADGGYKSAGDLVKALATGANTCMTGYLLAGTNECPVPDDTIGGHKHLKTYRGMASKAAQKSFYGNDPRAPEGVSRGVQRKGSVLSVIETLVGGIQSGMSYTGAHTLDELREKARFCPISYNGYAEGLTI